MAADDGLLGLAERSALRCAGGLVLGWLRFVFYGLWGARSLPGL